MKVSLFIGDMQPTEGGGYTFVTDLLPALNRLRKQCAHEFVLCHYQAGETLARQFPDFPSINLDAEKWSVLTPQERSARRREKFSPRFAQAVRLLKRVSSAGKALALSPWEDRIYRREGIQFLIRLAPWLDGVAMDVPFAMTVWDLQHRNSPWFPEVSAGDEWTRREHSYAELLRRASVIYTGTEQGRSEVVTYYQVPSERIKVLPFAAPVFALEAAEAPRDSGRLSALGVPAQYIFYPAQFWPHKNHVLALEACKIVRDRTGWDIGIVFCGADKGNLEYVRGYARRLGLEANTKFLGFVERADLVELYKGAFCLVFPTFFGPDNLPPLEAFALGCPVVASDVAGAHEQLGDAAVLFSPTDENALAEAIVSLRESATCERSIKAGHVIAGRCGWDDYARGIISSLDAFASVRRTWG